MRLERVELDFTSIDERLCRKCRESETELVGPPYSDSRRVELAAEIKGVSGFGRRWC